MIHTMHLSKEPFHQIWSGCKTIEFRMLDEKRRRINIGDTIKFYYNDDPKISMEVTVTALYKATSFKELFEMIPLTKCGYGTDDVEDAYLEMEKFPGYSKENQEKFGVIGIEFEEVPYAKPFRDPFRHEPFLEKFSNVILKYWQEHPDYRFGQILSNFQNELKYRGVNDFYCLEEEDFMEMLTKYVRGQGGHREASDANY